MHPGEPPAAAGLPAGAQIPLRTPASPGAAPRGAGAEGGGGLRCHLWGGVNNPSVYEPGRGIGIQRRATASSLLAFSPHPLRNKTQHKNKTRRRTEVIHRLYPIINIQAVVCTNTPSNHGGSPGRRIIFKLGSVAAAVPPRSLRQPPLLPGRRGTGTGRSPRSPGA